MFNAARRFMKLVELFTDIPDDNLIDCACAAAGAATCGRTNCFDMMFSVLQKKKMGKKTRLF
jgi:hypothetical protein